MSEDDNSVALNSDIASLISGVDRRHLLEMEEGCMSPSEDHADRIYQSLGAEALKQYNQGTIRVPESLELKRGTLPVGFALIRRLTVGSLRVGDLVPYLPVKKSKSSLWVEVRSIVEGDDNGSESLTVDLGGVVQIMSKSTAIRVARATDTEQSSVESRGHRDDAGDS